MSLDLFSMSLDLFSMSLDPRVKTIFGSFISLDLSSISFDLSSMSLDPRVKTIFVSFMLFYLSNMSLDLSSMSFYLSSMSLDLSSMSLDLSSMSFVDDPLSQSSLWGGMKHFLSALKNLLVGNLKNFILFIHDCSQKNFEENFDRDPKHNVRQASYRNRNTTWDRLQTGIETRNTT
ncbi:hypothetical protein TNCV_2454441 [Trichonephila clavipes]|nr:hypothetical protein TNCV_2454441 [Trichonephila clavipes]